MSHEMNSSFHADIYYTEHKILVGQPVLPKQCPSFLLFWALSKKKKKKNWQKGLSGKDATIF